MVRNLEILMAIHINSVSVAKVYGQTARDMRRLGRNFVILFDSDV